ncbi:MAG: DUF1540 domain-containing protein [Myxococcota bacterium]
MQITKRMTEVSGCIVADCTYNRHGGCHARGITVGDGQTPNCDTFFTSQMHAREGGQAGVGACKVTSCRHNNDFECSADAVKIGFEGDHARCLTYSAE